MLGPVGQRGGCRRIQDTQHLQSRDRPGIFDSLSLSFIEIRRSSDDGIFHRLTEIVFRRRFELLKDDGQELRGAIDLIVDLDVGVSVGGLDHLVGENVLDALDFWRVESPSDQPLDAVDGVLGIGQGLPLSDLSH